MFFAWTKKPPREVDITQLDITIMTVNFCELSLLYNNQRLRRYFVTLPVVL